MANTLTLTINVITKNAKEINDLIDRVDKLNDKTETGAPKAEKLGGGINVATLAAGAAALAVGALTGAVGSYVKSAIDAAARTEGLRNGLRTVIPDADEFEATLARIDKQARLPGLQKNDLLRFTTSMTAAGLSSDQVDTALTVLGSRIVGFGKTSAEAAQVVGQFTQAMNRGKIEGDELNRLFESLPGFKNIVVEMTGVTGGAQDLNDAFAAQGLTVQEGLIPLLEAYDASLGEINHDAALTKADAFEGALEDLRNTIGQKLLPIYKEFLDRGAEVADNLSALITGAEGLPAPILEIKAAFDDYLTALEPLIEPLQNLGNTILPLLKTVWNELVGIFVDFVIPTLTKIAEAVVPVYASLINLATPIANLITTYLPPLVALLKGLAGIVVDIVLVPLRDLAGAFGWVIDQITKLINLIPGAKTELETTATASNNAATAADKQATATDAVVASIKNLENKHKVFEAIPPAVDKATESTKKLAAEVQRLTDIYKGLTASIGEYSELVAFIEQGNQAEFFRLARGEIEGYDDSIQTVIPSIFNLTSAEDAFTSAIQANIATLDDFAGDAQVLIDTYESLSDGLTSVAADQAILNAVINLVNPAISDAVDSMREYIGTMESLQTEFQSVETISDMVTESVREQASAFDALRRAVDGVTESQSRLPGQQIGSGALDEF